MTKPKGLVIENILLDFLRKHLFILTHRELDDHKIDFVVIGVRDSELPQISCKNIAGQFTTIISDWEKRYNFLTTIKRLNVKRSVYVEIAIDLSQQELPTSIKFFILSALQSLSSSENYPTHALVRVNKRGYLISDLDETLRKYLKWLERPPVGKRQVGTILFWRNIRQKPSDNPEDIEDQGTEHRDDGLVLAHHARSFGFLRLGYPDSFGPEHDPPTFFFNGAEADSATLLKRLIARNGQIGDITVSFFDAGISDCTKRRIASSISPYP